MYIIYNYMFEKERTVISWFRKISIFSHTINDCQCETNCNTMIKASAYTGELGHGWWENANLTCTACHLSMWCLGMRNPLSLWPWWQIPFIILKQQRAQGTAAGDHQVVSCLKKEKSAEEPTNQTRFFQRFARFFLKPSFPTLNQNSHCTWPIEACVGSQGRLMLRKIKAVLKRCSDLKSQKSLSNEPKANPDWLSLPSFIFVKLWDWTCDYHRH